MIGELTISDMSLLFDLTVGGGVELDGEIQPPVAYLPVNPYMEPYEVTPSMEEQVLETDGHSMTANVVVHKIPSNYGLITYDGSKLVVS